MLVVFADHQKCEFKLYSSNKTVVNLSKINMVAHVTMFHLLKDHIFCFFFWFFYSLFSCVVNFPRFLVVYKGGRRRVMDNLKNFVLKQHMPNQKLENWVAYYDLFEFVSFDGDIVLVLPYQVGYFLNALPLFTFHLEFLISIFHLYQISIS